MRKPGLNEWVWLFTCNLQFSICTFINLYSLKYLLLPLYMYTVHEIHIMHVFTINTVLVLQLAHGFLFYFHCEYGNFPTYFF